MIGKIWFWCGLVLLPLTVIPFLFVMNNDVPTIGKVGTVIIAIQLIPLVGTIIPVEAALKKNFDESGMRR